MKKTEKKVKICYIAGREASYSRTRMMIHGLQSVGFDVVKCLPPNKSFKYYPNIMWQFLRKKRGCDLVIVGFYGQLLLPFVWLFTTKPILFDVYISTFGTMIDDRAKGRRNGFRARLYWLSDYISMKLANRIITESCHHIKQYAKMFRVPESKFRHIFLATDPNIIYPKSLPQPKGKFLVHFHGEYAPFHGVKYIFQAADILRNENVEFQIVGRGITHEQDMKFAKELNLQNCKFIEWVPYEELADYMSRAHCCLGFFGDNPRTMRVFTNKVVEAIAVAKPLISTKNEPVQELLKNDESALLVERANPAQIAKAIRKLRDDAELRQRIGNAGHELFLKNCTLEVFSKYIKNNIEEMLN